MSDQTTVTVSPPSSLSNSLEDYQRDKMFDYLFSGGDEPLMRLKKQALACQLPQSNLRVISWKMFLGLLTVPPRVDEWIKEISRQREHYAQLKEKHANLGAADNEEDDPNINNPLSLDASSPWSKYFENEQLRKTILQDVERTYPEHMYFQQQWVKDMMMSILYVYAKENAEVIYKQGMHELLAPIIFTLDQEKMTPNEGSPLSQLLNKNYIENDAFIIFERLMKTTSSWFVSNKNNKQSNQNKKANGLPMGSPQSIYSTLREREGRPKNSSDSSAILSKCQYIYHDLLKSKDPGLYSYISSLKIEPQLFLLRWVRLLFGREFPLNDTLILWDSIFAFDKNFTLLDYIAVSMMMNIREDLLSSDQNGVLQLLFKYPFNPPIDNFVETAQQLAKNKRNPTPPSPGNSPISTQRSGLNLIPHPHLHHHHQHQQLQPQHQQQLRSLSVGNPKQTSLTNSSTAEQELAQLRTLHNNIALRLENIVFILQNNLLPGLEKNQSVVVVDAEDTVFLTVAELKQIKDVMMGHLPVDSLPPLQPPSF